MTPSQSNSTRCPMGQSLSIFQKMLPQETDDCVEWPYSRRQGYGRVSLGGPRGASKVEFAHRLAYIMTHGSIPEGMGVLHHCDNPPCFNPRHLFAGTDRDNKNDQKAKDRVRKGIRVTGAKLTEAQVKEIRALYRRGVRGLGREALAKRYGISPRTIVELLRGETWKHLL